MINKYNACIHILSSRTECLENYLQSLYDCYNKKYEYPVYIYYFDDIYDSDNYRSRVHGKISKNIHFISVPYFTPKHIPDKELFYNRKDLWYVANSFSINRKGYLHMCNFYNNYYGYPNTEFEKYDYTMCNDDESGYTKELPYDPFDVMAGRPEDLGALNIEQKLKNGNPHQGHLDTRINLWKFTSNFIKNNNIEPKSSILQKLLIDENSEWNIHLIHWANSFVVKLKMFKTDLWKKWIESVNQYGGIYKYRWGDIELMSLFYLIYDSNPIYNFNLVKSGYHNFGMFRGKQDIAPNVKNLSL